MALGSAVYVQNPINWMLIIIALTVHHKIILVRGGIYGKSIRRTMDWIS